MSFNSSSDSIQAQEWYEEGCAYRKGNETGGYKQSDTEAVSNWQIAAEMSHAASQFSLGYMYHKGLGITQSYQNAIEWYRKAAEQNFAKAQINLGSMYERGEGFEADQDRARALYQEASKLGNAKATFNLAMIILDNKTGSKSEDEAEDEAFELLRLSAERGFEKPTNENEDTQLVFAIANSALSDPKLFNRHTLRNKPYHRGKYRTYTHWLAYRGLLDKLPVNSMPARVMRIKDNCGNTPLHIAAELNSLQHIPSNYLKHDLLSQKNKSKKNVVDIAYLHGTIKYIPKSLHTISEDYIHGEFDKLIAAKDFSDSNLFSASNLSLTSRQQGETGTYMHQIIRADLHPLLPPESFSVDVLSLQDRIRQTPMHLAAIQGSVDQLPEPYRGNKQLLSKLDGSGNSCFHYAVKHDSFGGIPLSLFTEEVLLLATPQKISVADLIEKCGNTKHLPEDKQFYCRSRVLCHAAALLKKDLHDFDKFARAIHPDVVSQTELKEQKEQFLKQRQQENFIKSLNSGEPFNIEHLTWQDLFADDLHFDDEQN